MTLLVAVRWGSVVLKLVAAVAGLVAAYRWHRSTTVDGAPASTWSRRAAAATAVSVALQAVSLGIDTWWVPPTASWG